MLKIDLEQKIKIKYICEGCKWFLNNFLYSDLKKKKNSLNIFVVFKKNIDKYTLTQKNKKNGCKYLNDKTKLIVFKSF